jgi:FkbM family methyltransferase
MTLQSVFNRLLRRDPNMQPSLCYGQEGEDLILDRVLEHQAEGFYVDVGAHHPVRFSNTYLFYKRGWRGINIDAMPGSMRKFESVRPRDINIECGIADCEGKLTYHRFNEPALNTFDTAEAQRKNKPPYKLVNTVEVSVERLDSVLERHLPAGQRIDFLTVDVEGYDLKVIQSNNWTKFRPAYVLVEALDSSLSTVAKLPLNLFLAGQGYNLYAKTVNTLFYREETLKPCVLLL